MKKSVPGDDWPPMAPRPRPGHRHHLVSIAMPFLGLAVAIGYVGLAGGVDFGDHISKEEHVRLTHAFWLLGIAGVIGLFAAGKSFAGKETPGCLAVLGLLLNIPPVLLWLQSVAEYLIERAGIK